MALRVHILRELECTPGASGGDVPGGADTSAASLLGGPFTFSSGAYQTGVRPGTAVAEGVARGLPLAVRLYAPLVVLNATQLPISIGVVQVEVQEVGQGVDGGEGGGGPGAPPARSALGLPSSTVRRAFGIFGIHNTVCVWGVCGPCLMACLLVASVVECGQQLGVVGWCGVSFVRFILCLVPPSGDGGTRHKMNHLFSSVCIFLLYLHHFLSAPWTPHLTKEVHTLGVDTSTQAACP